MMRVFHLLARLKGVRGKRWDLFAYSAERRAERALITQFEADLEEVLSTLDSERLPLAVAIAGLADQIRGFGHVKTRNMARVAEQRKALLAQWRRPHAPAAARAATVTSKEPGTQAFSA
jgi:indolepyruvate ferredoxin oxidoreductase